MNRLFNPEAFTARPEPEDPFPPGYFKGKPRPDRDHDDIKRLVVEDLLPEVLAWFQEEKDGDELEEICEQLLEVVDDGDDGYRMARKLEDGEGCWDADSELVEILDGLNFHTITQKAVLAWIRDNAVKPRLAVGAPVQVRKWSHSRELLAGEITRIYEEGNYCVLVPSEGHVREGLGTHGFILPWNAVEELNPEVANG